MHLMVNRGKAKGKLVKVTSSPYVIGRDPGCQLRPQSDEVSRRHAELKVISGIVLVNDLGSANGTRVNGQCLVGTASLRHGDVLEIGPLSLTVLLEEPARARRALPSTEDLVASWLADGEDGEPEPAPAPPRKPARAGKPGHTGASATATATKIGANDAPIVDELELLRALSDRTE